ncbi:single-stranded DNA-binding protein [Effusibacillus dendaii]|uniref:Single-stranded DNA-binding protein n=1 Tax=Effusibacillus dendaii TaxID=2743772 RepID=A0A7I8DF63_9BACL|nr:single-stranded DNA-binding protein [Effusibacillus dendaii]BCJ87506.1 single-stranded DNA-binding protein [Effusibacillus dendaii]
MLNRIILIGRLTADPELRYTSSGTAVASFTLAIDRPRVNQMGERETDFINIVVWQKLGELCAQYLRKGRLAAVEGRLQIRSYENKEGQRVRVAEVVADNVRFLDRGDNSGSFEGSGFGAAGGGTGNSGFGGSSGGRGRSNNPGNDDPFIDDGRPIDISDDDLPF